MKRVPMRKREARRRVIAMLDTLYGTPEFLRACDAAVNAMTLVQMAANLERLEEEEERSTAVDDVPDERHHPPG